MIFTVKQAEKVAFDSQLQLLPPPSITKDLNKGKGIVFNYDKKEQADQQGLPTQPKFMASAISAGHQPLVNSTTNVFCRLSLPNVQVNSAPPNEIIRFSSLAPAATSPAVKTPRVYNRKNNASNKAKRTQGKQSATSDINTRASKKRKAEEDLAGASKIARSNASMMVPREGPLNA